MARLFRQNEAGRTETVALRCSDKENQHNNISEVLDLLSIGILIVDADSRARLTNRYVDEVLQEKDGLFLERNFLKAVSSKVTRDLKNAIQLASNGVGKRQFALCIPRPSCLRPLLSFVAPAGDGCAVLFIADPERKPSIHPNLIADLMGLTPAESNVAALVTEGKRISQIADDLEVSTHTVQCHLRHVFSKTETVRQAELANYVGSLLGKLRTGDAANDNGF